jgi:hypothetical protein
MFYHLTIVAKVVSSSFFQISVVNLDSETH